MAPKMDARKISQNQLNSPKNLKKKEIMMYNMKNMIFRIDFFLFHVYYLVQKLSLLRHSFTEKCKKLYKQFLLQKTKNINAILLRKKINFCGFLLRNKLITIEEKSIIKDFCSVEKIGDNLLKIDLNLETGICHRLYCPIFLSLKLHFNRLLPLKFQCGTSLT